MAIKYISGINKEKQNLRRSVHTGSDLAGGTVLNPAQAFDPQAVFVYLNGVLLKEGTSGNGGDYTTTGNSTITFNSAVSSSDIIEVVSYTFSNPTLPETMIEVDHTATAGDASYHGTAVTGASFTGATNTVTATSHGLSVDDVITVTAITTSDMTLTRYRVKSVTDTSNFVIENMDRSTPSFTDGTSMEYSQVFSKVVNGLSLINKAMVFLNGMLLVENTDFYRDQQSITLDASVAIFENYVVHIRSFGAFVFPTTSEIQNSGIVVADDAVATLFTSADFTANITSVFNLHLSVRHYDATIDGYRTGLFMVRAEKNDASASYIHRAYDAGNISTDVEYLDQGNYTAYTDITDGKIGLAVHADANYWYVYLINRSGYQVVAGYKAFAVTN